MKLEATDSCLDLLAKGARLAIITLTSDAKVQWDAVDRLEHLLNYIQAGRTSCSICTSAILMSVL